MTMDRRKPVATYDDATALMLVHLRASQLLSQSVTSEQLDCETYRRIFLHKTRAFVELSAASCRDMIDEFLLV
jgi:hypothetical protein